MSDTEIISKVILDKLVEFEKRLSKIEESNEMNKDMLDRVVNSLTSIYSKLCSKFEEFKGINYLYSPPKNESMRDAMR